MSITWTDPQHGERTGEIWSPGPATDTLWVIPAERRDGEGHAVCVHVTKDGTFEARSADVNRSGAEYHSDYMFALYNRLTATSKDRGAPSVEYGYNVARGDQLRGNTDVWERAFAAVSVGEPVPAPAPYKAPRKPATRKPAAAKTTATIIKTRRPTRRGDLAVIVSTRRDTVIGKPSVERTEAVVCEVTNVTREGKAKAVREAGRDSVIVPIDRWFRLTRIVTVSRDDIDVTAAMATAAAHTYPNHDTPMAYESLEEAREAIRPHRIEAAAKPVKASKPKAARKPTAAKTTKPAPVAVTPKPAATPAEPATPAPVAEAPADIVAILPAGWSVVARKQMHNGYGAILPTWLLTRDGDRPDVWHAAVRLLTSGVHVVTSYRSRWHEEHATLAAALRAAIRMAGVTPAAPSPAAPAAPSTAPVPASKPTPVKAATPLPVGNAATYRGHLISATWNRQQRHFDLRVDGRWVLWHVPANRYRPGVGTDPTARTEALDYLRAHLGDVDPLAYLPASLANAA